MRDLSLCFGKPVVELVRKSDQVICEWGDVAVEGLQSQLRCCECDCLCGAWRFGQRSFLDNISMLSLLKEKITDLLNAAFINIFY